MKIRISGNSIRFRLGQSEVDRFAQEGEIRELTSFGQGEANNLCFVLTSSVSGQFTVSFQNNTITLQVPQPVCREWTSTELVGFKETIEVDNGRVIKVLVEKDFKCLDGSDSDNWDAYPNPNLNC